MKIYYWTPYMEQVGTIKATINSAIALSRMGHEVKLYKPYREWEGYEEVLKENHIDIIDFHLSEKLPDLSSEGVGYRISMLKISFFAFGLLKKNYETDKPDVIISSLLGYLPLLVREHAQFQPKIVCSIQGKPKYHSVRKVLWNWLYAKADKIITLTESTKNDMQEKLKLPREKYMVLANPVIDASMDALQEEQITDKFYETDEKIILGVGRLTRQKDFKTLMKAFSKVKERVPSRLVILGEGEDRKALEDYAGELGIEKETFLPGFVKNPYKYIAKADVFVLSSLWEDPGHVLMEAAYLKTPIVSTRCPHGPEEFLSYGKAGELCDVGNDEEMAECICSVLQEKDKAALQQKVDLAYENSLQYHMTVHGKKLEEMIEALVES